MNQPAKLLLSFVAAGIGGNLMTRAIIASAPTPTSPPLGLQAMTSLGLVAGSYVAWTSRNDTGTQSKDVALAAAIIAGLSGGALAGITLTSSATAPALSGGA